MLTLKTQCYFKLKYLMEKREIRVNTWEIKDKLQNELDNILVKDLEWENKIRLESKEDMKKRLWHSPWLCRCDNDENVSDFRRPHYLLHIQMW